jgi:hypothetical protein
MQKNVGPVDKVIRLSIAAVIVILYYTEVVSGVFGLILLGVGGISILTGFMKFCGLYRLLGISTCPKKDEEKCDE